MHSGVHQYAHEQLLLSEGVCRQLSILQYHTSVEPWRGGKKQNQSTTSSTVPSHSEKSTCDGSKKTSHTDAQDQSAEQTAGVPTVQVRLAQSLQLLPHQGASVSVEFEPDHQPKGTEGLLLEPSTCESLIQVDDSLLQIEREALTQVRVFICTGSSCVVEAGTKLQ